MTTDHLHRKKAIVTKEEEYFGTIQERHLPSNVGYNPEDIGEFGKPLKHHHHKAAIKKVHKHLIGNKPLKQKLSQPGRIPRNIGLYGKDVPMGVGSKVWSYNMDKIVKRHTGWDSLAQMCAANPTLRVSKGASANESQAIHMMRDAYKFVTGKEAYPQENWDRSRKRR